MLAQECVKDIEEFQNKNKLLKVNNILVITALEQSLLLRNNYMNVLSNPSTNDIDDLSKQLRFDLEKQCPDIVDQVKDICEQKFVLNCLNSLAMFNVKSSVDAIKNILKTVVE